MTAIHRLMRGLEIISTYDPDPEMASPHYGILVGDYESIVDMMIGADLIELDALGWREQDNSWYFPL